MSFIQEQYDDLLDRPFDPYAQSKYEELLSWISSQAPMHCLNVGCGSGELSFQLAQRGHTVVGIDPVPDYIELAKSRTPDDVRGRCFFQVSTIEAFVTDQEFDLVVATDVLEHIEDDRAALAKLVRHVRPGGKVLLTVPAGPRLFGYHDELLGHFRRYDRPHLKSLASSELEVRRVRYMGFPMIPIVQIYSRWLRKSYPVSEVGNAQKSPIRAAILKAVLRLDRWLPMPMGTTLLLEGDRPASATAWQRLAT